MPMDYKVQFDVFEGPMDLLLYLVRKQEVDIYQVNLTQLATEFIQYIEFMRELDLEVAGEFVVMAATLMYIKSKELLPKDKQVLLEDDEEGEDPRWELIRQLVEYKKFKDAAAQLKEKELEQESIFVRQAPKPNFKLIESREAPRPQVNVFDLVKAVGTILQRIDEKAGETREIQADTWSVSQKIEMFRRRIKAQVRFRFSELFQDDLTRQEVVVTFLALLEMIRMKQLQAIQPGPFEEIEIHAAPNEEEQAINIGDAGQENGDSESIQNPSS
ncbi:MAG: segregation/condensation protein A [Verrucomicrobia bacterium]|nr:segregation/condensation protein A [Verrucomicrobiota bacterium]